MRGIIHLVHPHQKEGRSGGGGSGVVVIVGGGVGWGGVGNKCIVCVLING